MKPLRVFLIWKHPLLRDTVQIILEQVGYVLVGESNYVISLLDLQSLWPDVILVEDEDGLAGRLLAQFSRLNCPRLLCINMADNKLLIYRREERLLSQTADLVTALQN